MDADDRDAGDLPDELKVPAGPAEARHRVQGSRFLARVEPVASLEAAATAREEARRRHHDATHHVYACRLADGTSSRDDDGEPSGTGGRPALRALDAAGLRQAVVTVTRWFGGTELGRGGLARAYGRAARRAAAAVGIRRAVPARTTVVRHGYGDTGAVRGVVEGSGARVRDARYGEAVELELAVPLAAVERAAGALANATGGRAAVDPRPEIVLLRV